MEDTSRVTFHTWLSICFEPEPWSHSSRWRTIVFFWRRLLKSHLRKASTFFCVVMEKTSMFWSLSSSRWSASAVRCQADRKACTRVGFSTESRMAMYSTISRFPHFTGARTTIRRLSLSSRRGRISVRTKFVRWGRCVSKTDTGQGLGGAALDMVGSNERSLRLSFGVLAL